MKKNRERIAEYLSGLLSESERKKFEAELASSDELQNEYDRAISGLEKISLPDSLNEDERYFAGILPRVREKTDAKKKFNPVKIVYYAAPAAAAVIIFLLIPFGAKNSLDLPYKEFANQVIENIADKDVSDKYFTELETAPSEIMLAAKTEDLPVIIPAELELKNDSYTRAIDSPLADEYGALDRLSEEQLEIVFKNLKTTSLNR